MQFLRISRYSENEKMKSKFLPLWNMFCPHFNNNKNNHKHFWIFSIWSFQNICTKISAVSVAIYEILSTFYIFLQVLWSTHGPFLKIEISFFISTYLKFTLIFIEVWKLFLVCTLKYTWTFTKVWNFHFWIFPLYDNLIQSFKTFNDIILRERKSVS